MILSKVIIYEVVLGDNSMQLASKAKVTNFDSAVLHDEQISWLDVSMHDSRRVNIFETTEQIEHYGLNMPLGQEKLASINLAKVGWGRLKYQIQ